MFGPFFTGFSAEADPRDPPRSPGPAPHINFNEKSAPQTNSKAKWFWNFWVSPKDVWKGPRGPFRPPSAEFCTPRKNKSEHFSFWFLGVSGRFLAQAGPETPLYSGRARKLAQKDRKKINLGDHF